MQRHNPYGPLLQELSDVNYADTDQLLRASLRESQKYVKDLRQSFGSSPSKVDYSIRENRAAYLLAYYPHYIEILYEILSQLPHDEVVRFFNQQRLQACFFGCGPAPEVLGWVGFLQDSTQVPECAVAYLLDKYIDGWHKGQEITRYHLAPTYWPNRRLITVPLEFDLLDSAHSWNARIERAIGLSSFFVMQNCLNDHIDKPALLLKSFMHIFEQTPLGAVFVITDLNFSGVLGLMCRIEKEVNDRKLGVVIKSAGAGIVEVRSNIDVPAIIREELLTGDDGLIPRQKTKFNYMVLQRSDLSQTEEEIPF